MFRLNTFLCAPLLLSLVLVPSFAEAQQSAGAAPSAAVAALLRARDPGPRPNPKSSIPRSVPGLTANEMALFTESLLRVSELEGTCDTCVQQPQGVLPIDPDPKNPFSPKSLINSAGMGPVFNADQCVTCHMQPTLGGSATRKNAAFEVAHRMGASNVVPSFEEEHGAFREVRFKFKKNGERDGGVHSLFTLAGRSDVPNTCRLEQPDFEKQMQEKNLAFRIPLQLFGLGLIEAIPDTAIRENWHSNQEAKRALGIAGHPNINANTGTISRFGWKAQNASLTMFAGEAYNVEMGISNDLFPTTRSEDANCNVAYEPFDVPRVDDLSYNNPLKLMPAWLMFTEFMRFVDAPPLVAMDGNAERGKQIFNELGCSLCHTPAFHTLGSANPNGPWDEVGAKTVALRGQTVNLYSDLLVHHMGATLADNVVQGNAGPDEFRTTPLWGLGQRIYFLHDGRTSDLVTAIQDHFSFPGFDGGDNPSKDRDSVKYGASEANGTVMQFNRLPERDKQALLNFLRTL